MLKRVGGMSYTMYHILCIIVRGGTMLKRVGGMSYTMYHILCIIIVPSIYHVYIVKWNLFLVGGGGWGGSDRRNYLLDHIVIYKIKYNV